jgi:putative ABC transport system permease protein
MKTLSHAFRQLRRSPIFTGAAVLSLALGIGANAAVFTLVYALLLRPIAVREPDRLVQIGVAGADGRIGGMPVPIADRLRREGVFQRICSFLTPMTIVEIGGRMTARSGHALAGDCVETLGVGIAAGRALRRDDDRVGAPRVAMLTYGVWQREFGGRADVIGKSIAIDGEPATIVGVTERRFNGVLLGFPPQVLYPLEALQERLRAVTKDGERMPTALVFARLGPDDSIGQVNARLRAMWPALLRASLDEYPAAYDTHDERTQFLAQKGAVAPAAAGLDFSLRNRFDKPLFALLAVAAVVLLVACANVANLLLARAAQRRQEIAIRVALGASRWRLVRDVLVESTLLLGGGVGGGLLIAYWSNQIVLARFGAAYTAFALDVTPDARVLAFTSAIAAAAFVAFAIVPAWRISRGDSREVLAASSTRIHGDRGRLRQVLVVAQVALTLTLVTGALLFTSVLVNLQSAPLGLDTAGVLSAQLGPIPSTSPSAGTSPDGVPTAARARDQGDQRTQDATGRALLDRLAHIAGVRAAALANFTPLFGRPSLELASRAPGTFVASALSPAVASGSSPASAGSVTSVLAERAIVTGEFFSVMGIPLVAGEGFPVHDASSGTNDGPHAAIISESLAMKLFGRRDPIGERIQVGRDQQPRTLAIVGVARDAVLTRPQVGNTLVVYQPFDRARPLTPSLIVDTIDSVETAGIDARSMEDAIRRELQVDGRWYPIRLRSLSEDRDAALSQERLLAWVSSAFGLLGLTLAAVGLYGLLALSVARRTGEIGIRMALGADRSRVVWMIVRDALVLIAAGIALGLPIAWTAASAARALLPGIGSIPLATIAFAVTVLVVAGALAAWLPARRASAVTPLVALRRD